MAKCLSMPFNALHSQQKRLRSPSASSCNLSLSHSHLKGPNARVSSPHKSPGPTMWGPVACSDAATCQLMPAHALPATRPHRQPSPAHAPGQVNNVGTCIRLTSARVTVRMNRPGLVSPRIRLHDRGEVGTSTNMNIVTPTHLQRGSPAQRGTVQCQWQPRSSACCAHIVCLVSCRR